MQIASAIVIFIIIWWCTLFCVLPVGMSTTYDSDDEDNMHQAPGAPKNFNLKKKAIITTVISIILWAIVYTVIKFEVFDIREWALEGINDNA